MGLSLRSLPSKFADVLVYGDLCANDLIFAEHLARKGLNVIVARVANEGTAKKIIVPESYFRAYNPENLIKIRSSLDLIALARRVRLVVTFTASLGFSLNWKWILRRLLRFPPIVNIATGSDFSEVLDENTLRGRFMRYFVKTCDYNFAPPYTHIIKNIIKYRIKNVLFIRPCYYILPDSGQLDSHIGVTQTRTGRLRYFHPSHLDFKVNDPGAHRNSSKGNDRFIRAFIRAVINGLDAECVILSRGPDKDVAKAIIDDSGFADRFIWKPHLTRTELFREFMLADVVVDQFDAGSATGGIALEAMALGKPILTYLQDKCPNLVYPAKPPVISARTEEEIYQQLMSYTDREELIKVGKAAQAWAFQNHSWEKCIEQFLVYYTLLTGHKIIDYGWEIDPYSNQK